jgi:murein DD-endopeptidase MepM/ murein hydrolase activator NlpD
LNERERIQKFNMVIVPRVGKAFYNVAVSYHLIYVFAGVLVLALGVNLYILTGYLGMKSKVANVHRIQQVDTKVESLTEKTAAIENDIEKIKEVSRRIQDKTGISVEPGYVEYSGNDRGAALPSRSGSPDIESLNARLQTLRNEVEARKQSVLAAEYRIDLLSKKYSHVPSIRPVRSTVVNSGFGYRTNPITGSLEFHEGLDLEGDSTSPIYATADGTVSFAGWRQGYGLCIGIDHGNGFSTLYAHSSRTLVYENEKVKKGQIIAFVGSTGSSTGQHLHYEVHYQNRLLNPTRFLTLSFKDLEQMF